jgi:hypothetical protein
MRSIVDLPVEIILAILQQLIDEDYNLHLRRLSLANKFLCDVTNLRLWRSLRLKDGFIYGREYGHWLRERKDVSSAVLRDRRRAACVLTLRVDVGPSRLRWAMYLGTIVRHLEMMLAWLPSLRSLRFCGSVPAARSADVAVPSIASMLFRATLPFRLTHFECPMSMLRHMAPFLRKQDTIERLDTVTHRCDDEFALSWVQYLSVPALPHLKHCKGSPLFVQTMARSRDLRSAIFVRTLPEPHHWILLNSYKSAPPTRVDYLGISQFPANRLSLPHSISNQYRISVTSIKHLALRAHRGYPTPPPQPTMLRDFPQLESFEYEQELPLSWARFNTFLDPNFIARFEQNCPTLRRTTLVHYDPYPRSIEFIRKDSLDSIVIDEKWETAMWGNMVGMLPVHCDIQVPDGLCWRARTSINKLADMIRRMK